MNNEQKQAKLRREAFEEFKRIAAKETANGAVTLALIREIPKFSRAPLQTTRDHMMFADYWSRHGDGDYLIQAANRLYNWRPAPGDPYRPPQAKAS